MLTSSLPDLLNPLSKNYDQTYCNAFKLILQIGENGIPRITKEDFSYLCTHFRKQFERLIQKHARTLHQDMGGYYEGISICEEALMDAVYAFIKNKKYLQGIPFMCHYQLYMRSAIQKANRDRCLVMIPHNVMAEYEKASKMNVFNKSDYDLSPEELQLKEQLASINNMIKVSSISAKTHESRYKKDEKGIGFEEIIPDEKNTNGYEDCFRSELGKMISENLDKIDAVSCKCITMYFGFNGKESSLREVAAVVSRENHSISHTQVKTTIENAIEQLKEYMLESEKLMDFLEA